jgi:hypothetical protein
MSVGTQPSSLRCASRLCSFLCSGGVFSGGNARHEGSPVDRSFPPRHPVTCNAFLRREIGEVLKIDQKFPYRRVTRYGLEVLTVMLYGVSFGLARVGSYFAVVTFGLALFSGAAWCNALYVEGNTDPRNITTYAETLRALHYLGGLLCLLQFLTFGVFGPARLLSPMRSLAFAAILSAWIVFYEVQLRFRCGVLVGEYSVDFIVTPRRIRRWKRWRSARTRKAQVNRDLAEKARRERFIRPDNGVDEQEGDG